MHYAADYGQTEVLQYLVSKGANINTKDKHGISVILAAIWEGHIECVKFLIQKVKISINFKSESPKNLRFSNIILLATNI